jgi:hypothetical protein
LGVVVAKMSELLYEVVKNFKCYSKFSANSVGTTTKKLQYPSLTRKCRGVVRLSGIQALQYVSSNSHNNANNECSITDNSLLLLPVSKARVQVIMVIHRWLLFIIWQVVVYILCYT